MDRRSYKENLFRPAATAPTSTIAQLGEAARRKVLGRSWAALTGELIDHYAAVLATRAAKQELAA